MRRNQKKTPDVIDTKDIKIRKRIAPGVRVFEDEKKKKKVKHKKDWLLSLEE